MVATRNSAGDHSNMSSIYKPVISYAKNVVNTYRNWEKQTDAPQVGQFYGALLQGRRYDTKTGKQITGQTGPLNKVKK